RPPEPPTPPRPKSRSDGSPIHDTIVDQDGNPMPDSPDREQESPRTFEDPEGGTPILSALNESVTKRRRQGEYVHRPPVWNIRPIQNSQPSFEHHPGSEVRPEDLEDDRDMGVEDACQFCQRRLPGPALSPTPTSPAQPKVQPTNASKSTAKKGTLRKKLSSLRSRPRAPTIPPFNAEQITNHEITFPKIGADNANPDASVLEGASIVATDSHSSSSPPKTSWSKLTGLVTNLPTRLKQSVRRRYNTKGSPYGAMNRGSSDS
ncbi:hypothetical protein FQN49_006603, partial [Arthroderma sp. PD_2]